MQNANRKHASHFCKSSAAIVSAAVLCAAPAGAMGPQTQRDRRAPNAPAAEANPDVTTSFDPDSSLALQSPTFWAANGPNIYNTNTGYVGIRTATPESLLDVRGPATFQDNGGSILHVQLKEFSSYAPYSRPNIGFYRSRGSKTAPSAVNAGDHIWSIEGSAFDGSSWDYAGGINMTVDSVTNGVVESSLHFDVSSSASGTGRTAMSINKNGNVGINAPPGNETLVVGGQIYAAGVGPGSGFTTPHHGWYQGTAAEGSPLRFNNNGYNVTFANIADFGIGVINPTHKFHVAGTGRFEGGLISDGNTSTACLTITGGCDVAEPFEIIDDQAGLAEPGMIVSIDRNVAGKLRLADKPFDTAVAGIVSGAGGVNTGMTLSQRGKLGEGIPVALTGRVCCWCDASNGAIHPGDLLTTSATPGHAMRVAPDADAPRGAVIGKALSPLSEGKGLVLVLVNIQ